MTVANSRLPLYNLYNIFSSRKRLREFLPAALTPNNNASE